MRRRILIQLQKLLWALFIDQKGCFLISDNSLVDEHWLRTHFLDPLTTLQSFGYTMTFSMPIGGVQAHAANDCRLILNLSLRVKTAARALARRPPLATLLSILSEIFWQKWAVWNLFSPKQPHIWKGDQNNGAEFLIVKQLKLTGVEPFYLHITVSFSTAWRIFPTCEFQVQHRIRRKYTSWFRAYRSLIFRFIFSAWVRDRCWWH